MTIRIKYDSQIIKLMYFFESTTNSKLKDCFIDKNGVPTFVVGKDIGLAIGKNGSTARKIESALKKKIKIVAYSDNLEEFIRNLLLPLKIKRTELTEENILIITPEPGSRGYIIGRAGSNLRNLEDAMRRYFEIKEIRVV